MESEGRGKRSSNQLQGAAVQDQTVRSVPAESRLAGKSGDAEVPGMYRVVVRYEDRAVRGLAGVEELGTIEQLLRNDTQYPIDFIRLRLQDSDTVQEVPTKDA